MNYILKDNNGNWSKLNGFVPPAIAIHCKSIYDASSGKFIKNDDSIAPNVAPDARFIYGVSNLSKTVSGMYKKDPTPIKIGIVSENGFVVPNINKILKNYLLDESSNKMLREFGFIGD